MVPRYSVLPLVERVGSLLAARLTPATALHLGALGEVHQADALLNSAARCLLREAIKKNLFFMFFFPKWPDSKSKFLWGFISLTKAEASIS